MNTDDRCPRCGEGSIKSWHELEEEEREVVKRLPASAEVDAAERQRLHRWCTRCWYESRSEETLA
jgi:ribosomal protein S27AE